MLKKMPKPQEDFDRELKELQSNLKALALKIHALQYLSHRDAYRYEALLKEIYDRNGSPGNIITCTNGKINIEER